MLIAVIADTHMPRGSRRLPDACVARLRGADLILHAGDLVASETLDEIESLGVPVAAVHGNMDTPGLRCRLPAERVLEAGEVLIALVHDAGPARGRLARLGRRFPGVHAVVFGHSHVPLHEAAGGFQIFNPGSPTERRRQPRHTMGMAKVDGAGLTFELIELD